MPAMTKEAIRKDEFVLAPTKQEPVYETAKRLLDIFVAIFGIVLALPFMLLIAIAIKLEDGGPVFFVHSRVGQGGKSLSLYKFRSMVSNEEELINQLSDDQKAEFDRDFKLDHDPRITKVGSFLRKTSLDELPQLINVVQGTLSVVGPRPVVRKELNKYGHGQDLFLSAKPGVTGYWQVNGRSDTTYESGKRQEMELYYAANRSFALDVKILIKTVSVVLKGKGAR